MNNYRIRELHDVNEWKSLFSMVPFAHVMQSYTYGEAKRRSGSWNIRRLAIEKDGIPAAICQVIEKRVAGIRLLSRINRGPLFIGDTVTDEEKTEVYKAIAKHWKWYGAGPLLIAPALDENKNNRELLVNLGFKDRRKLGYWSFVVDLRRDEEAIMANIVGTWRNRLRLSMRNGLELRVSVSPESVDWMAGMHIECMKQKEFKGPSAKFIKHLHEVSPQDFIVLQALSENKPVAGMALVTFGRTALYYVGWFGEEGRKLAAGNFLYWNCILELKKAGFDWFDLGGGGHTTDHVGKFKRQLRCSEYQLIGEWICY